MKKNIFSDKESSKSSKGFYAALGISALMIGSACYFAYNQGEKLNEEDFTAENSISASEAAVDRKSTDIPKIIITTAVNSFVPTRTTVVTAMPEAQTTTAHIATLPASAISVADPPKEEPEAESEETVETASEQLANVTAPLADISNVINPFSGTELVKNETTGSWQTHNGTDIASEIGSEVFAVSPGEITEITDDPLWGTIVVIDHHNGYISRYCSLAKELSVQLGDTVVSGDVIGVIGDTADIESALDPHLHIEIIHNGEYQNPMELIQN